MKLSEYDKVETRALEILEYRAKEDNETGNEAARILLEHIRVSKRDLGEWQRQKDAAKTKDTP